MQDSNGAPPLPFPATPTPIQKRQRDTSEFSSIFSTLGASCRPLPLLVCERASPLHNPQFAATLTKVQDAGRVLRKCARVGRGERGGGSHTILPSFLPSAQPSDPPGQGTNFEVCPAGERVRTECVSNRFFCFLPSFPPPGGSG